ncbi:helix-turn-helix domain-containing protein [Sorangium sp. So ce327]|uniref:helix-turn-helix domain-containing protein n=1 Tax=Sorangium sp. So ce327 TaxID=3133301 RepID=UPI003F61E61B
MLRERRDTGDDTGCARIEARFIHEAKLLQDMLETAGWNRTEAARRLGIPVRTLSYRMKVLGVKRPSPR